MGEAKRRGTLEQRVRMAKSRNAKAKKITKENDVLASELRGLKSHLLAEVNADKAEEEDG